MQPKQNPTNPEALLLVRMKRDRAKAAMDQFVRHFGVIGRGAPPGLEVLLDYLTNMVYALELLLKVMSNDWRKHHVGEMYQTIFGRPHACADLMTVLERAIVNQKFIYEPADRLMDHIPELEILWDELNIEFGTRNFGDKHFVKQEVVFPPGFISFLRNNLGRFYRHEGCQSKPPLSREHLMQKLQYEIAVRQQQLAKLEAGELSQEESLPEQSERLHRELEERLQQMASCFDFNMEMSRGHFSIGMWRGSFIHPGCLG